MVKENNQSFEKQLFKTADKLRYVGIKDEEDDGIPFEEKMTGLTKQLTKQISEEKKLDDEIKKQLKNSGFNL